MREEQQKDRDRVTRRSGTKMFRGAATPKSAEPIRAFDDDRQRDDARQSRKASRDGRAYYDEREGRFERDSRRTRDEREDDSYRDGYTRSRRRDDHDDDDYARDSRRDERRYRDDEYRGDRNESRYGDRDTRERARKDERTSRESRGARADKPSANRPAPHGAQDNTNLFVHQVVPYVMFWVALFAAVSFLLRDVAGLDASVGTFGSWFADFLCGLFGIGAYFVPLFLLVLSLKWKSFVRAEILGKKIFLSASFLLLLSGIIHVFQDVDRAYRASTPTVLYAQGVSRAGGGFFGGFVGEWLGYCLRLPGTCLLAIPLLVIVGIYLVGLTPGTLWQRIEVKFKMIRQRRREERGANGNRLAARATRRSLGEGKEQEAAWKEPQPLAGGTAYDFGDEETVADPVREAERRAEKSGEGERLRDAEARHLARARLASEVNELLDIPDDEPEFIEPSEGARTILTQAGHTDDVGKQVEDILRDMEDVSAIVEPTSTAQEEGKEGSYYAPFALPVRPEPKRDRPAQPATASPKATVQMAEPATVKTEDTPAEDDFGEVLGSVRPAGAATAYTTPWRSEPAVQPQEPVVQPKEPIVQPEEPAVRSEEPPAALYEWPEASIEEKPMPPNREGASVLFFDEEPSADEMTSVSEELSEEPEIALATEKTGLLDEDDESYFSPNEEAEEAIMPAPTVRERVEPMAPPAYFAPTSSAHSAPVAAAASYAPTAPRFEPPKAAPVIERTPIRDEKPEPPVVAPREYVKPPISLLNEDKNIRNDDFYEEIEDTKQILRDTLESFNIHIKDEVSYSHGPAVTRYELRPVAGTSVRSVTNRIEDISLNLASAVRIEAPIPGKPAIGIEVPNKVRETVYMRTMLESEEFRRSGEPLEVPLGLDVGGSVRLCNLAKMPHLLVAGTTGSGKSVCINSILLSLIYKTSPRDLRLILIDPKQIEFAPYEHVPHLYMPIVTDMQRAAGALACAVQEMERRFTLIKDVGVRNIEAYNEAVKNDPDREHLPYMVIVIDEFADLKMSCSNNDPENFTCRIAQKARAAGIHLIIGTQRPSVDVITGKLKSNIPSRIAFMVKQQVDSRTILDVNGAEALTGRGDMLYMPSNSSDKAPTRIQGAFVSDGELERVISYVRKNNDPVQYNQAFMDQIEIEMARAQSNGKKHDADDFADDGEGSEDPKFVEAVKLAVETQKVATSLLQRRLGVGYGRAAKIIDRMEELGLVSASEGNKPRQVLAMAQGYLNHLAVEEEGGSDDLYE